MLPVARKIRRGRTRLLVGARAVGEGLSPVARKRVAVKSTRMSRKLSVHIICSCWENCGARTSVLAEYTAREVTWIRSTYYLEVGMLT